MELAFFHYYFSVTGFRDGLCSVELKLRPDRGEEESAAVALRRDFERLEALLDGMFLGQAELACAKRPTFADSPNVTRVGHAYEIDLKTGSAVEALVQRLFRSPPRRGLPAAGEHCRCELAGELARQPGEAQLELRGELGHALNLALLDRVLALPGLRISARAQEGLDRLREVVGVYERDPAGLPQLLEGPGKASRA